MNEPLSKGAKSSLQQLATLLKPKNLLRTAGAAVPIGGSLIEMWSQLDGAKLDERVTTLEEADISFQAKLLEMEKTQPKPIAHQPDWPSSVGDYMRRIADFVVVFDGAVNSPPQPGMRFLRVGHGCFIGSNAVLTCREVIELANGVANHKKGVVAIHAGIARYEFELEETDSFSGLIVCKTVARDEKRWQRSKANLIEAGLPETMVPEPLQTPVSWSLSPWPGQDVGFVHNGEAEDAFAYGWSKYQFDKTSISHLREPRKDAIKSFVTGVLSGRILKAGSAVFGDDGGLLGIIADTVRYESDKGIRAVFRSLLGHPRFSIKTS